MVPGRNIRGTFDLVLGGNKWQYKLVKIATYLIRAVTPRIVQHRVYCWVGCWVSKKMPKKGIELSAVQVKRLNKPGMHAVGGVAGLLLQVSKSGARSWILRATVGSRRRDIGLGGFPDVTLAQAREKARVTRGRIDEGIDPIEERRAAKAALRANQAKRMSFADAARRKHEAIAPEFRNARSRASWLASLEQYAIPHIGDMAVADVEMQDVLSIVEPIWREKTHTANRVRQRMEAVFDWAIARKYRDTANPAVWKANLAEVLPKPAKISRVKRPCPGFSSVSIQSPRV